MIVEKKRRALVSVASVFGLAFLSVGLTAPASALSVSEPAEQSWSADVDTGVSTTGAGSLEPAGAGVTDDMSPDSLRLVGKHGCFEILTDGAIDFLTNVCADNAYGTARFTRVYVNGQHLEICLPQHSLYGIGVRSEWSYEGYDSWPSGCEVTDGSAYLLNFLPASVGDVER